MGYASLSDDQLIKLACIVLDLKANAFFTVKRDVFTDGLAVYALAGSNKKENCTIAFECIFNDHNGLVGGYLNNEDRPFGNPFLFVDKCHEYGVNYPITP